MKWGIVMTSGTLMGMLALVIGAATSEAPMPRIEEVQPEPAELKRAA